MLPERITTPLQRAKTVNDDPDVERTAAGLWLSYEAARQELIEAERFTG